MLNKYIKYDDTLTVTGGCNPSTKTDHFDWRYRYSAFGDREQKRLYYSPYGDSTTSSHPWEYNLRGAGGEELALYKGRQTSGSQYGCSNTGRRVYMYPVSYYTNGGELVTKANGVKEFTISDHLGSTRTVVSSTGHREDFDYKPFGEPLNSTTPRIGFTGKERNIESSYINMGARQYDPSLGRFMSPDPLFELSPSHNPYHYCQNSPLIFKDPSGLDPENEYNSYLIKKGGQTYVKLVVMKQTGEVITYFLIDGQFNVTQMPDGFEPSDNIEGGNGGGSSIKSSGVDATLDNGGTIHNAGYNPTLVGMGGTAGTSNNHIQNSGKNTPILELGQYDFLNKKEEIHISNKSEEESEYDPVPTVFKIINTITTGTSDICSALDKKYVGKVIQSLNRIESGLIPTPIGINLRWMSQKVIQITESGYMKYLSKAAIAVDIGVNVYRLTQTKSQAVKIHSYISLGLDATCVGLMFLSIPAPPLLIALLFADLFFSEQLQYIENGLFNGFELPTDSSPFSPFVPSTTGIRPVIINPFRSKEGK